MRNPFAAIAVMAALTIFFSLASLPREWDLLRLLLLSRITRRTLGGPAPLLCNMPQSSLIPDTYFVSLANSYSLEQHKRKTGRAVDLDHAILDVEEMKDVLLGDITFYEARTDDASLVNAVRADLGVLFVECKGKIHLRTHRTGSVQPTPFEQMVF
jgi:hypothetical protein